MAKAIMIQGTGSHVGKSTLVTALCRILSQDGHRVAPFKAQNMALNSFITGEGYEMGRAQAVQALAAGIEPQVEMNPILLKATSDLGAQVILMGRVVGNMKAKEYQEFKQEAWGVVKAAYAKLEEAYDFVVIEGAGSPAEINLKKRDICNMHVARLAKAPVILVGDIDRGGVFASLVGTLHLLTPTERSLIAGFVINKFRGDLKLLSDGLKFLERETRKSVLGVIPYLPDLFLEEEDGVALDRAGTRRSDPAVLNKVRIGIIYLPHISNFTDFDPFKMEPNVELFYVRKPAEVKRADVLILPGSKNTIDDLLYLRQLAIDRKICEFYHQGGQVIGICGGVQMLGKAVRDPYRIESRHKRVEGLGLLPVETVLQNRKITAQVQATLTEAWGIGEPGGPPQIEESEDQALPVRARGVGASEDEHLVLPHGLPHIIEGYEIHMGHTRRLGNTKPAFLILKRSGRKVHQEDGAISADGRVWGTYLHGLFENDLFRKWFLDRIRRRKEWPGSEEKRDTVSYDLEREWALDRLAQVVRKHLDLKQVYALL